MGTGRDMQTHLKGCAWRSALTLTASPEHIPSSWVSGLHQGILRPRLPMYAEEREESREVTQSLVGKCTYLEEALQEAVRQLTDSQAAESRMQSQNSILRAENKALTSR